MLCLLALGSSRPYQPINVMDLMKNYDILMADAADDDNDDDDNDKDDDDEDKDDDDDDDDYNAGDENCPTGCHCSPRVVQCSDQG